MARNGRVAKPFYKDGIFYVRRRVPQDLVPVVGRQLYLKSLGTSIAAEAAHLFPAANAAVTTCFQQLRSSTGTWPSSATVRLGLGSGLIGHSQKMTVAARATAERNTVGQRS